MASQHLRLLITPPPPPCPLAVQRATKRGPLMEVISLPYRASGAKSTELYSVCVVQHLTVNWPSQPQPTFTTVLYNYVHAALVVCASHRSRFIVQWSIVLLPCRLHPQSSSTLPSPTVINDISLLPPSPTAAFFPLLFTIQFQYAPHSSALL